MFRNTLPLFRVRGIQVGVHISWLVVFALVTWSLAMGFLPEAIPDIAPVEAWLVGGVSAILLFASVLLHELAHSFAALSRGLPVHSITLFLFGGVSNLSAESKEPRTEFLVAAVGPLTSFAIAGAAFLFALLPLDPRLGVVASYLAIVNLLLGGFNLIPGFPLDGGRVLRAIVWKATGSIQRATQIAASVGQFVGYAFIAWGVLGVVDGDLLGGLWTAAIGLFLQNAAASSVQHLALEQRLAAVRVRDAFTADATAASPGLNLGDLIEDHFLRRKRRAVLVVGGARLVGIVTVGDLQKVARERRGSATAAEVMTPADRLITIAPAATLQQAADVLAQHEFDQLPVVDDGRGLGIITRADIMREFQIREALDIGQGAMVTPTTVAGEPQPAEG
ncbi:MAG TPA: site-2 protease family protein [Candidatus Limnocylindrales bacterium]|nr:site-2 protease family protein [Candidatus Limnocylindrales bacterium]